MKTYLLIVALLMSVCRDLFAQGAGTALQFDGVDDVGEMGDVLNLTGSDLTVEVWVKTTDTDAGFVVGKHTTGVGSGYVLHVNTASGYGSPGKASFSTGPDASGTVALSSTTVTDGQWHHIAGVYSTAGTKSIYVDGNLEATQSAAVPIPSSSNPFQVGRLVPAHVAAALDGQLDEVRVWNVALTTEQIQANMHRALTGSEAGLVGYWRFDEGVGTADLTVTAITHTNPVFSVNTPFTVAPSDSHVVTVTFHPTTVGTEPDTLVIESNTKQQRTTL